MDLGAISGSYVSTTVAAWAQEAKAILEQRDNCQLCSAFSGQCSKCNGIMNLHFLLYHLILKMIYLSLIQKWRSLILHLMLLLVDPI